MELGYLLEAIPGHDLDGDKSVEITGIAYDSRNVSEGYLFVAVKGHAQDGHVYLNEAVDRGAVAIVAERFDGLRAHIAKITVRDSRDALSRLAVRFYNDPCANIELIGITGTNGKTTTTYLIESMLSASGAKRV